MPVFESVKQRDLFLHLIAAQCAKQYRSKFAPQGAVEFQLEKLDSRGACGRILCSRRSEQPLESRRWLVRYFRLRHPLSELQLSLFYAEWRFYSRIVPAFNFVRPLPKIIPLSCWRKEQRIAAFMIHLPDQFCNLQLQGYLDYAHASLMATAIGQFHAYSYRLRPEAIAYLSVGLTSNQPHRNYCVLVKPTLQRCLQGLVADEYLLRCNHLGRFQRLHRMVNKLEEKLDLLAYKASRSPHTVFSHQNYTREQVSFLYVDGVPQEVRIVEWRSVGRTSLGVDLVTLLFVECDSQLRKRFLYNLIAEYYKALTETFIGPPYYFPTLQDLMAEIRMSVPVALCILGLKNSLSSGLWDDGFIMRVFEDLIETNLVDFDF